MKALLYGLFLVIVCFLLTKERALSPYVCNYYRIDLLKDLMAPRSPDSGLVNGLLDCHAYSELGYLASVLGQQEAADEWFSIAVKRNDSRHDLVTYLWSLASFQSRNDQQALEVLQGITTRSVTPALFEYADRDFRAGNIERARRMLVIVSTLEPKSARFVYRLGQAYEVEGKLQEAVASYERAALLSSDNNLRSDIYLSLGNLYRSVGDLPKKKEAYEAAIMASSSNTYAQLYLSDMYVELRNYSAAIEILKRLMSTNPDFALTYVRMGDIALKEGGSQGEARSWYEQGIAMAPQDGYPYWARGRLALQQGDISLAVKDLEKTVSLGLVSSYIWQDLGQSYEKAGRTEDAATAYERALKMAPQDGHAAQRLLILADSLAQLGRVGRACELWRLLGGSPVEGSIAEKALFNLDKQCTK